jgi:AAA+ superfamily predicted ATPase
MLASGWKTRFAMIRSSYSFDGLPSAQMNRLFRILRRNTVETIAKPNRREPLEIPVRLTFEQEMMTMIKVGSKEEVALLLAFFGVLDLPVQAPKRKK